MSQSTQRRTRRILIAVGFIALFGLVLGFVQPSNSPTVIFIVILLAASVSFGALALHFWNRPRARPIVLAIAVICTLGIGVLAFMDTSSGVAVRLGYNQRRWQAQQITSYRYTLRRDCFCSVEATGPVRIEVRDGAPVSITYIDSGAPADIDYFAEVATIDKVFQFVEEINSAGADYLSVTYDSVLGYPRNISTDYDDRAFDDEASYEVTDFEIIR